MKLFIKTALQSILGFETFLFLFSVFKILTLKWDRVEGDFMRLLHLIGETGTVIDVGANIGIMTVLFARRVGKGQVYAFEPVPVNFKTLQRVASWFRLANVLMYRYALGDIEGEVTMVMPRTGLVRLQGISHVVSGDDNEVGDRAEAPCKRLDNIEALFSPQTKVTAIKIDVEGYEFFVLKGAQKLIATHRPIIYCEIAHNENYKQTLDLIHEMGYIIKILIHDELKEFDTSLHRDEGNFFLFPLPDLGAPR